MSLISRRDVLRWIPAVAVFWPSAISLSSPAPSNAVAIDGINDVVIPIVVPIKIWNSHPDTLREIIEILCMETRLRVQAPSSGWRWASLNDGHAWMRQTDEFGYDAYVAMLCHIDASRGHTDNELIAEAIRRSDYRA